MPTDTSSLLILGVGAAILLWLAFSILKKLVGVALLAAAVFAAYIVWTNPSLLRQAMSMVGLN